MAKHGAHSATTVFPADLSDEPPLPGNVLRRDFMEPEDLTATALASDLGVATNRITRVLNGERGITAATALLLARRFGTTAEFWMNLQVAYDLAIARKAMTSVE